MTPADIYYMLMGSAFTMCLASSWVRAKNLIRTSAKAKMFDLVLLFNISGATYFAVGGFHMASHPLHQGMNMAFAVAFWVMCTVPLYVYVLRTEETP